jgi:hypothetical protein
LISGVGEDALDERKAAARLLQQIARPVAVLNVSGQNVSGTATAPTKLRGVR